MLRASLEDQGTLFKDTQAYGGLAGPSLTTDFRLLWPRIQDLIAPCEQRIREQALAGKGLVQTVGNCNKIRPFVQAIPERSLLDGADPGRVRGWALGLLNELDRRIDEIVSGRMTEIEAALSTRSYARAKTLARDLQEELQALKGEPFWMAKTLLGEAVLGQDDLVPAVLLFREVLRDTESNPDRRPDGPRARAACGWAEGCIREAKKALGEARQAIGRRDGKRLRQEVSDFTPAVKDARSALDIAVDCGNPPKASTLRKDFEQVMATWVREVEPQLENFKQAR